MAGDGIAFIGGGNMAASLIGGLVADGRPAGSIRVSDPEASRLATLAERYGVHTTADNAEAVRGADTVVFAVKPQVMAPVVSELAATMREVNPLVISIAAGVREPDIRRRLGFEAAVVRTMPNTPALVRTGATALYANENVSAAQRERAETIMHAVGIALWVEDEALLDAVTAVSGSGPAYYFLLMELMEEAGVELGLTRASARRLTLQTALGAARMANDGDEPPATLRARVTSPGGTTQRALETLQGGGIEALLKRALRAARDRATELGDELSGD